MDPLLAVNEFSGGSVDYNSTDFVETGYVSSYGSVISFLLLDLRVLIFPMFSLVCQCPLLPYFASRQLLFCQLVDCRKFVLRVQRFLFDERHLTLRLDYTSQWYKLHRIE